eukprot:1193960-Prorocentrum_minimum.AAC.1
MRVDVEVALLLARGAHARALDSDPGREAVSVHAVATPRQLQHNPLAANHLLQTNATQLRLVLNLPLPQLQTRRHRTTTVSQCRTGSKEVGKLRTQRKAARTLTASQPCSNRASILVIVRKGEPLLSSYSRSLPQPTLHAPRLNLSAGRRARDAKQANKGTIFPPRGESASATTTAYRSAVRQALGACGGGGLGKLVQVCGDVLAHHLGAIPLPLLLHPRHPRRRRRHRRHRRRRRVLGQAQRQASGAGDGGLGGQAAGAH